MQKITNNNQKFDEVCSLFLEVKSTKKELEKKEKGAKEELKRFASEGIVSSDMYELNISERSRKKVKDEAPALLQEFLGKKEASKYVVTLEVLPEEVLKSLVNSGKITAEQGQALYNISAFEVLTVKEAKHAKG